MSGLSGWSRVASSYQATAAALSPAASDANARACSEPSEGEYRSRARSRGVDCLGEMPCVDRLERAVDLALREPWQRDGDDRHRSNGRDRYEAREARP